MGDTEYVLGRVHPATAMPHLRASALLLALASVQAAAQGAGPFPRGEVAPNVHHTGTVWLSELVAADDAFDAVSLAAFAPGATLDWHVHPGGQVLLVTEGEGYVQQEGGPVRTVRAGDVVRTPPGVRHWHAATPERGVVYLAVTQSHPDGRTVWAEPVTAAEYAAGVGGVERELLALSRQKWLWMADRDVDALAGLFHPDAVFVHMGGAWGTERELDVIRSGSIWYKHAEVEDASVRVVGETAVVLNTVRLDAVVGGAEVTNPFEVTEVYVREGGAWALASLSFTRLSR